MQTKGPLKLFALNGNQPLAQEIAKRVGTTLGNASVRHFSDGEIQININDSIRGCEVFLIQSVSDPVNENLMELLIMIDALHRASANTINVILPYYAYSRADRKAKPREPITAKLVANLIELAGADRVIGLDFHADQLQGFFNIPVDHLLAVPIMAKYFVSQGLKKEEVAIVTPDHAGAKNARSLASLLEASIAIVDQRAYNPQGHLDIVGDVKGKNCIIYDDMIDTGVRAHDSAIGLKDAGAKDIYVCATHAVFSGGAEEILQNAPIKEIVVTDSIVVPAVKRLPNLITLSVGALIGDAIELIYKNESVNTLFVSDVNKNVTL